MIEAHPAMPLAGGEMQVDKRLLAVVFDPASRPVTGWAMRSANDMALGRPRFSARWRGGDRLGAFFHHSDRVLTYTITTHRAVLTGHGRVPSMIRADDCWDNAMVRLFFSTQEFRCFAGRPLLTAAATARGVATYIVERDDRERMHSRLGVAHP
jgi:transposase InsO family protein